MTNIRKIRGLHVLSFVGKCPCGKEIPYGRMCCQGHGNYGKQKTQGQRVCSMCKSDKTYINKTKKGKPYPLWLYVDTNTFCKSCYDKQWQSKHKEYIKIYNILYRDRRNHLARIRASIKRGYWVDRID